MEMNEEANHHLGEEVDLMDVTEEADSSISKRFLNVTWKGEKMKQPTCFEKITHLVTKSI